MKRDPGIDVCTIWIYLILWTVQLNVVKTVAVLLCNLPHTVNPHHSSLPMGLSAGIPSCGNTVKSSKAKLPIFSGSSLGWRPAKRVCLHLLGYCGRCGPWPMTSYAIPLSFPQLWPFKGAEKRRQSSALEPQTQEAERNEGQAFSFVSIVSFYLYLITPESWDQPSFSFG